jgi:hypothetical protein
MGFLSGRTNVVLVSQCNNLQGLTMTLEVTEDMVTVGNTGFGIQLNCFPQPGQVVQGQTLNWFQYVIAIGYPNSGNVSWAVEYWNTNGPKNWPSGYTPNPPNTSPQRPVIPNDSGAISFGTASNNQILAGSVLEIQLVTDPTSGNVSQANFTYTDPSGKPWPANYTLPSNALFPIYGFKPVVVGPFNGAPTSFSSGAGTLTYSVSSGSLGIETKSCGGYGEPNTAEDSNAVYGAVTPATGSTVTQAMTAVPMTMSFAFEQSTFGEDEVEGTPSWNPAYYLELTGFPNGALGLNVPSDLDSSGVSPLPTITLSVDPSLNAGLSASQITTIKNNLPVVNTFAPPILAIDSTLATNYQTLMYPYNISFPNLNAFNALSADEVAVITLSAELTVQVPTSGNTNNPPVITSPVTVNTQAAIELAKGEDPRMEDLNPTSPLSYPSWLSYDLRIFTTTAGQSHDMFSVASPTNASEAISYIQNVLKNLNTPSLITNGDTFDNALTQNEDASSVPWLPTPSGDPQQFSFAIARVRIKSSINTTISPVRVFFRLFAAASTVTDFVEVGTGEGLYRWGTNGTAGHKIPLLGVQGFIIDEYVTIPCFANERVNLNGPADMNQQLDPYNALSITTIANQEVDTYYGCWLDVNQTTPFLLPFAPVNPAQWDGPWTGTESLNGAVAVAPHQCLVAEIRYDDTPIPTGADTANSDKLAQRNIAWLGVQP